MKRYLRVQWHHDLDDEPLLILSEIDAGMEVRKVEVFRDGHSDFADETTETGSTRLSEKLMPSLDEIASQDEFTPDEIEADAFEIAWRQATSGRR